MANYLSAVIFRRPRGQEYLEKFTGLNFRRTLNHDPERITVTYFLKRYKDYCEKEGCDRMLFGEIVSYFGSWAFEFDDEGNLCPSTHFKNSHEINMIHVNSYWRRYEQIMGLKRSPQRKRKLDSTEDSNETEKSKYPKKLQYTYEKDRFGSVRRVVCSTANSQNQNRIPGLSYYKKKYGGRNAFEEFLKEFFTRVVTTDSNVRKMYCVRKSSFLQGLEDFCQRKEYTMPNRVSLGSHLGSIGIYANSKVGKAGNQERCYTGLKWKERLGINYNLSMKKPQKKKVQENVLYGGSIKYSPPPSCIMEFMLDQSAWRKVHLNFDHDGGHSSDPVYQLGCKLTTYASFSLGCHLQTERIARKLWNVKQYGRSEFKNAGIILTLRNPLVTASVQRNGKVIIKGRVDEVTSKKSARKIARLIQRVEPEVGFENYKCFHYRVSIPLPCKINIFSAEQLLTDLYSNPNCVCGEESIQKEYIYLNYLEEGGEAK
ncbi:hypothetical protein SK128_019092, partial [Halocaridina rubra]